MLKRTLSESFVGVPLTDGLSMPGRWPLKKTTKSMFLFFQFFFAAEENSKDYQNKNRPNYSARSLSFELAKHKHRLAAQLVSFSFATALF